MALLTAAVAAIGALAVFNLVLTHGVVRRLRLLDARLGEDGPALPPVGHRVGAFEASTLDGETVTQADLARGEHVVALLSGGCASCEKAIAALAGLQTAPRPLLFVHPGGDEGQSEQLLAAARQAGRVALVKYGQITKAFGANAYPTIVRVTDGLVAAAGHTPQEAGVAAVSAAR